MPKPVETMNPTDKALLRDALGVSAAIASAAGSKADKDEIIPLADQVNQKADAQDVAAALQSKASRDEIQALMKTSEARSSIITTLVALLSGLSSSATVADLLTRLRGQGPTDTTPPTIITGNATVMENQVLNLPLQSDDSQATWMIVGGADAAQFEISNNTLRWAGNGSKDFEAPTDQNGDNVYVVSVTATDIFLNASAPKTLNITVTDVVEAVTPVAGLSYTPGYVPGWTRRTTKAALLAALGLTAGDVIDMSDYPNPEAAIDAAGAVLKPIVVGVDNGRWSAPTTRPRVYCDVPIYGFGIADAQFIGASRLEGWLVPNRFDLVFRNIEFKEFSMPLIYAPGTMPLVQPDASGYDPATTAAKREPYHTSTDRLVIACRSTVDAGFIQQACAHIWTATGSPTVSGIVPVRQRKDGGPGGTRSVYAYSGNTRYDESTAGQAAWNAALDNAAPNLLAAPVANATNASLAAAINANTATSGFSAAVDPWTGKVVILSQFYDNRPLDFTITVSGGTVGYDTRGVSIDMSYSRFMGCDRPMGGISDVTAVGKIIFCKNIGRATWGWLAFPVMRWTEAYMANNDWQDCLANGGQYGPIALRSNGNAMPSGSNQNQNNTLQFLGSNNVHHMRYSKLQGGTKRFFDNNYIKDIEGVGNTDTVNAVVASDTRNIWDTSGTKRANHSFSYNWIENFRNLNGAIDSNVYYIKGGSDTVEGNVIIGFGAARISGPRGAIGSGSEAGGFLAKDNGTNRDPAAVWYVANNFLTGGPNGIPWIKWESQDGNIVNQNNRLKGWTAQLDDKILGPATNRQLVLATGTGSVTGTTFTVENVLSGVLYVGMRIVFGSVERYIKSGSGTTWTLNSSTTVAAGTSFSADLVNIVDGALIRSYDTLGSYKCVSNFFENIADQGRPVVLIHSLTNKGTGFASWEISNNIAQNDNSPGYPAHTGDKNWFLISNSGTVSGMGSVSTLPLGRNKPKSAAGVDVGNLNFTYAGVASNDNGNTTLKAYVAVGP